MHAWSNRSVSLYSQENVYQNVSVNVNVLLENLLTCFYTIDTALISIAMINAVK